MYTHRTESLFCTQETNNNIVNQLHTSIYKGTHTHTHTHTYNALGSQRKLSCKRF